MVSVWLLARFVSRVLVDMVSKCVVAILIVLVAVTVVVMICAAVVALTFVYKSTYTMLSLVLSCDDESCDSSMTSAGGRLRLMKSLI